MEKRTYRPDEIAVILHRSIRTIYRMLRDGRLTVADRPGPQRIPRESLESIEQRA